MPAAAKARQASGREPLGLGLVEAALEREDVALEPGQQVEPGAEAGVRDLGQMGVQVDHARQERPTGGGRAPRRGASARPSAAAGESDATARVDDQQAVGLVARAARVERRQEPGADANGASRGQVHRAKAAGRRSAADGGGTAGPRGAGTAMRAAARLRA